MAAQMILRASGRVGASASADSISALGGNGTLAAAAAAAAATAPLYATHGAFRALAIAALGFVGGAAYLCYSRGVGLKATHRPPLHIRQRAKGRKEEWRQTRLRGALEIRRMTRN